ncbi:hypothetical protein EHQ12_03770 [Leptospira gomenensis]|uniref:Uncharacterized protein n=1 Tax=Leptospira gomenensis TaxID=2484974 RepID=A0A5F1YT61_9LEPT|nr:hypothetical protein [Leptospira gomenensis]TGK31701.1 hypothetical protein EHQ17_13025 [Leptospira gomenensis]TGK41670.1 hypothetical protein EHQ07_16445 [Leptospira gomenensis]TGK43376.1 hypothetical protein EHQ12_03770 [Leptospira gomenensis]TGK61370.1 hypothetical protein EHQ13_08420 [Leptospira gomenensis]
MANITKHDRVRIRFLCDQVGTLREKGLDARSVFDRCWDKIPEALIQKLNTEELLTYVQRHVLPVQIVSLRQEGFPGTAETRSA